MAQVNAQMRPLFSKLPDGFHIGLNISVSHINAPTFIDDCLHYQRGFEGKAVKLMLEITEQEPLLLNGAVVDSSIRYTPADFPSRWTTLAPAIPGFPVSTAGFRLYQNRSEFCRPDNRGGADKQAAGLRDRDGADAVTAHHCRGRRNRGPTGLS